MDPNAVWQRVHASSLQSDLNEAISHEWHASKVYARMAKQQPMFLTLARQEACHAKQLTAVYYLLYGCKPCLCEEKVCICNFCQALRDAFLGELTAVKQYESFAQNHPEHKELFCALAGQERCHARQIRSLTHQLLR